MHKCIIYFITYLLTFITDQTILIIVSFSIPLSYLLARFDYLKHICAVLRAYYTNITLLNKCTDRHMSIYVRMYPHKYIYPPMALAEYAQKPKGT